MLLYKLKAAYNASNGAPTKWRSIFCAKKGEEWHTWCWPKFIYNQVQQQPHVSWRVTPAHPPPTSHSQICMTTVVVISSWTQESYRPTAWVLLAALYSKQQKIMSDLPADRISTDCGVHMGVAGGFSSLVVKSAAPGTHGLLARNIWRKLLL